MYILLCSSQKNPNYKGVSDNNCKGVSDTRPFSAFRVSSSREASFKQITYTELSKLPPQICMIGVFSAYTA